MNDFVSAAAATAAAAAAVAAAAAAAAAVVADDWRALSVCLGRTSEACRRFVGL